MQQGYPAGWPGSLQLEAAAATDIASWAGKKSWGRCPCPCRRRCCRRGGALWRERRLCCHHLGEAAGGAVSAC